MSHMNESRHITAAIMDNTPTVSARHCHRWLCSPPTYFGGGLSEGRGRCGGGARWDRRGGGGEGARALAVALAREYSGGGRGLLRASATLIYTLSHTPATLVDTHSHTPSHFAATVFGRHAAGRGGRGGAGAGESARGRRRAENCVGCSGRWGGGGARPGPPW